MTCLGINGDQCLYLDPLKQFRQLSARDHGRNGLSQLCAPKNEYLFEWMPRLSKDGEVNGFRAERVADALMAACARKGVFNPSERLRGCGAWLQEKSGLDV